jgi:hypothetical protein
MRVTDGTLRELSRDKLGSSRSHGAIFGLIRGLVGQVRPNRADTYSRSMLCDLAKAWANIRLGK